MGGEAELVQQVAHLVVVVAVVETDAGERGTEDAQLNFPEGLAISSSNKLYIADRENNRVQVWQLTSEMPLPDTAEVEKFKKAMRTYQGAGSGSSTTKTGAATTAASGQ